MKNLATLVFGFLLIGITANATTNNYEISEYHTYNRYDGTVYIFEEGGVEFSVFADGQFDFSYVGQYRAPQAQVVVNAPNVNISFNAGHNYELFLQYDDYGAVIQIENVPIYYDNYGRITQAGNVDIRYNNRRIVRVGGLFIHYNYYGHYVGSTGFINVYNQFYVYRPWHAYYVAPIYSSCIVYDYPYRRHYNPTRYSYVYHRNRYNNRHRVAYQNARRSFNRPGSRVHYESGRTARNNQYNPNRRNTMISESRGNGNIVQQRPLATNGNADRNRPSSISSEKASSNRGKVDRIKTSSRTDGTTATSRPMATKRTAPTAFKSENLTVNRSSSSLSNRSSARGRNTNSRSTSSKRGRGL